MKFIISANTATQINERMADELLPIAAMFGAEGKQVIQAIRKDGIQEITHLKHVSVTLVNGEWIFEISDELSFKHISLFGKVARMALPLVVAFKTFASEIKREAAAIDAWINERK